MGRGLACALMLVATIVAGCQLLDPEPDRRVLFVGNSLTYGNDVPRLTADICADNGTRLETATIAVGGASVADHATDGDTVAATRADEWDAVVLQQQSQLAALPGEAPQTLQAVERLRGTGSSTRFVWFETWARLEGWPEAGLDDADAMQAAVAEVAATVTTSAGIDMAPVGRVWQEVHRTDPSLVLWAPDGNHATPAGSWTAAMALAATLCGPVDELDPVGSVTDAQAQLVAEVVRARVTAAGLGPTQPG